MALPQTTSAPAHAASTDPIERDADEHTTPLAMLPSLPRHTIALATIAATVGAMIGYDLFLLGWGSALDRCRLWRCDRQPHGRGGHRRDAPTLGAAGRRVPRGHMLLVVTEDTLDVHERSIITGRAGHRLRRYGRHQLTAVGFQKQLLTTVVAIRFSDGSTLHQDSARWAKVEDFVDVLTR